MKPKPFAALNHFTVPCSFTDVFLYTKKLSDALFPETLWEAGRLSLIHQDTAVSGWETKKRPQVESCDPLKNKRRNKSNKRKHRIAEIELRRKGDSRMNQGVVTARARLRQAGLLTGEGYERTDRGKRRKLTQSK